MSSKTSGSRSSNHPFSVHSSRSRPSIPCISLPSHLIPPSRDSLSPRLSFPTPCRGGSIISRSRLCTICITAFFASSLVAFHVFYFSYLRISSPVLCLQSIGGPQDFSHQLLLQSASDPSNRERVRFPRTKRRLPQCIIVGVRKCGTRALLEFLNLHPMIQKAAEEVHYFDDDSKYSLGLEWYRRRMPYSFPGQITIEKSPAYFITPSVPARIRSMNHSVKILIIVRDPVTRLVSDYAQLASNKARKDRQLASFEDMVFRKDGSINTAYKAVQISMYAVFFRRWLRTFPRHQIHVVDGDQLVLDPFNEIQKIENFLDISHRVKRNNFYYNKTKGFYCVRNETADKCLNESKGRKHPSVSTEVMHKLRQFYAPYNSQFYRQIGRSFRWPDC